MIFRLFSKFITGNDEVFIDTPEDIANKHNDLVDDLNTGLGRLKFADNFETNVRTVTIASGAELKIPHSLGVVPSDRIILRQTGNGLVVDGPTEWNENNIYLKNEGPSEVTFKVRIFK